MTSNKTSVVIVHWNTPNELESLLQNINTEKSLDIVVVDNNSDKSITNLEKKFTSVLFIHNKVNRGYAFACNQGFMATKGEWVLFLNPDIDIQPQAIKQLVHYANTRNLDAVSPNPDSENYMKPLPTPLSFLTEFTPIVRLIPHKVIASITRKLTLFGGALCIRRSVLEYIGGWDERFFIWFEDSDLTKQLFDYDYKVGWAPIHFKHTGGASFDRLLDSTKRDIFFNSMGIYADKYFDTIGSLIVKFLRKRFRTNTFIPETQEGTSITIPNMQKDLLDSFLKDNKQYLDDIEHVIVVTSAIDPDEIWPYRKKYPHIRFIPIEKNKGFTHTVNIGFKASPTTWVGTVNDDVTLSKDWVSKMIKGTPQNTGSLNPVIENSNGKVESSGVHVLKKGKAEPIKKVQDEPYVSVDATNAAAVLYKHEALDKTGLFDEKFGSYLEDIDLSLRIRKANFDNIVCTEVKVTHIGQSTSYMLLNKSLLDLKNWNLVVLKNWSIIDIISHGPSIFIERLRNISGVLKS